MDGGEDVMGDFERSNFLSYILGGWTARMAFWEPGSEHVRVIVSVYDQTGRRGNDQNGGLILRHSTLVAWLGCECREGRLSDAVNYSVPLV